MNKNSILQLGVKTATTQTMYSDQWPSHPQKGTELLVSLTLLDLMCLTCLRLAQSLSGWLYLSTPTLNPRKTMECRPKPSQNQPKPVIWHFDATNYHQVPFLWSMLAPPKMPFAVSIAWPLGFKRGCGHGLPHGFDDPILPGQGFLRGAAYRGLGVFLSVEWVFGKSSE